MVNLLITDHEIPRLLVLSNTITFLSDNFTFFQRHRAQGLGVREWMVSQPPQTQLVSVPQISIDMCLRCCPGSRSTKARSPVWFQIPIHEKTKPPTSFLHFQAGATWMIVSAKCLASKLSELTSRGRFHSSYFTDVTDIDLGKYKGLVFCGFFGDQQVPLANSNKP